MRLLSAVRRRIAAHACWYEELPMVQAMQPDKSDDDHEFDRDLWRLNDYANAVMDRYYRNTRALVTPADVKGDIAALEVFCEDSEKLYGAAARAELWPDAREQHRRELMAYVGDQLL